MLSGGSSATAMTPTVTIQPPSPEPEDGSSAEAATAAPMPAGSLPFTHPLTDRRRATRIKRKFVAQMTPWSPGHASTPVEVVITDVSDTGAGVVHDRPIELGLRHLLTVPRDGGKPVTLEYTVVRCELRSGGQYFVGLERADHIGTPLEDVADSPKRVTSSRLKLLFLAFGVAGLLVAVFIPL